MKVILLGTNGWYDSTAGNTISILIRASEHDVVLDAGYGLYKLDRYLEDGPVHLFLSHFHLDHLAGLHVLNKFLFSQGLNIYGQPGTKKALDTIISQPFTVPFKDLPYPVEVSEMSFGAHQEPFPLECLPLIHSSPCMGYRLCLDGRTIAYCPDTGLCENAARLARGADLLIAECSYRPGERSSEWPHLNPEDAVSLAEDAGAKRLVLVHFDACRYPSVTDRLEAASGLNDGLPLTVGLDDMIVEL